MIGPLLRRGLLVGVVAGLVAGCFAFVVGEPLVQDAIDREAIAHTHASAGPAAGGVTDLPVPRGVQRLGVFVAMALYGACVGTLFAVAFVLVRGRGAARDDWQLSVRLAAVLFVAVVLVPFVKYPANPPGVGDPATIATRTWMYLALLAGCLISLVAAARLMWRTAEPRLQQLTGAGVFIALATLLVGALPGFDEVPASFPASLLWEFRLSALGTQALLWTVLGVGFGLASVRAAAPRTAAS
jgi:hypothetical protein